MKQILRIALIMALSMFAWGSVSIAVAAEDDAGTDGAAFMKVALGARQAGMGEAFTGLADDGYAIQYNPAGIVFMGRWRLDAVGNPMVRKWNWEFTFMRNQWVDDTNQNYVGLVHPMGDWALSLGAIYFDEGSVDERDRMGNLTGSSASAYDAVPSLGIAYRLSKHLGVGVTGRMLYSNIADETATGFSADVGLLANFETFMIGASAQNLGSTLQFLEQSDNNPMVFRGGIAIPLLSWVSQPALKSDLVITSDIVYRQDNKPYFNVGGEYVWNDLLALRGGYKAQTDIEGLTLGAGFMLGDRDNYELQIDYAYAPLDVIQEDMHRVSLTLRFGPQLGKTRTAPIMTRPPAPAPPAPVKSEREILAQPERVEDIVGTDDESIEIVAPESAEEWIRLRVRINFDFDKSDIRPDMEPTLQKVGEILRLAPNSMIQLEGHTDAIGSEAYNIGLSYRRATSVMDWLIKHEQIAKKNFLKPVGYGETRPIAPNSTAEGRWMNRRVVVIVYNPGVKNNVKPATELKDVQVRSGALGGSVEVAMTFDGMIQPQTPFSLPNPERLVIDLPGVLAAFESKTIPSTLGAVQQVRVMSHQEGNFTRVVLDLTKPSSYEMKVEDNQAILLISP